MYDRSDPRFALATDLTVRGLDVMRHLMNGEVDKVNEIIEELSAEQGWKGLLALTRAMALLAMDVGGMRERLAAERPDDAHRLVDEQFWVTSEDGSPRAPHGQERDVLAAGVRFLVLCADPARGTDLIAEFARQSKAQGDELPTTISGVMTITLMVVRGLPEHVREQLQTFRPDSGYIADLATGGQPDPP